MNDAYKKILEKQQYMFSGKHTAVKVCGWTKKALKGEGTCYKQRFYGIQSHKCVQMAPSINFCNFDCTFCWRDRYNEPYESVDDPKEIIDKSIDAQLKLINGFGGNDNVNKKVFDDAQDVAHFAISLTGEPTSYPKISKFIENLNKRKISSMIVSNGSFPKVLKKMEMPTQLYISLDAPDKKTFIEIDRPDKVDSWEDLMETIEWLPTIRDKTRIALRLTLLRNCNMDNIEKWAELLNKANVHFIEVKGYMFVGASQSRLSHDHQPSHEELKEFCKELEKHTDYKIVDEQKVSRVFLMMKDSDKHMRFLDEIYKNRNELKKERSDAKINFI
ncbi:4-demethylwyosine synthase TYW1 [Candidatus Woesearchaeota archaeon]|jgi:tRNA wybutosine-synthesizing protein 1|nr:4-demethylwyosine synthase TYW1 [Candidatus Woesearchaeota archaeon]MBT4388041.1 4-demethylwyosine synthase TYW1 [Candidatus Woesearchaeota archaeon]MBT4596306.1 4-demethylwyosine synthase TYW1 [Candidatus Woesearchaeota archaeon]MBT5740808.1 4-demethylwyosine synthase TYW1 [Candidatus Woesearchaeota archaeon]MBT6506061.1 4-demethylwyosine synthase TYW1 [Candidatus Woesearchaeota archaeon]